VGRIENLNRYVLDYELKALADSLRVEESRFSSSLATTPILRPHYG